MFRQLKRDKDLEWLERNFRHIYDIIRESPIYEWILAEGREEQKAQGLAQMRQTVVEIVQERFPALAQLAEEVVATMDDLAQLRRLAVKLSSVQNTEQAHKSIVDLVQ
jgi:predicted transposase YdaD